LSPGQKARLGLLALRLAEPNFYLMDEPTNHVDIAGLERLEARSWRRKRPAFWSHTTGFFVRAIGTRFFRIKNDRMLEAEPIGS